MELIARLFSATIGAFIGRKAKRLARAVALTLVAALFLVGLIVFLVMAGFFWLRTFFPPPEAALIAAGVMLVLMALCILPLIFNGRRGPARAAKAAEKATEEVAPLVQLLKAAGLHGEAAGILAGAQLAGRVRPIYLVAAAIVVGMVLGRRLDSRGPRDKSPPN